ncbi:hypothetical protein C8R46DRAFT_501169 [Mycena filopes]|nr:hypothetical protein C8R46DRAFT_501169 [Mycena filopes]
MSSRACALSVFAVFTCSSCPSCDAMSLPDPRAQPIISQATHQLSTVYRALACPTRDTSPSSTPKFFFHPHTPRHPFIFDSGAPPGTLRSLRYRSSLLRGLLRHPRYTGMVGRRRPRWSLSRSARQLSRRRRGRWSPAPSADDSGSFLGLRSCTESSSGSCNLSAERGLTLDLGLERQVLQFYHRTRVDGTLASRETRGTI